MAVRRAPPIKPGSGGKPAREHRPQAGPQGPRAGSPAREEVVALQLAIGREGIGLELARPAAVECLLVTELAATLSGIRFPVDVSGGVPRFRHRRGDLQQLQLELRLRSLERWAAPRLRGVVGTGTPEVWVAAAPARATVCVSSVSDAPPSGATLAFEVHAIADDDAANGSNDLLLVVNQARGVGLPAPATAMAIACVEALLGNGHRHGIAVDRAGTLFRIRRPAQQLLRALLPEAGARVPSSDDVRWVALGAHDDVWVLHASRGAQGHPPDERALLARETSRILHEADEALVAGRVTDARAAYVDALERAPRHPEITRRIVDIDLRAGGRAEAALAMLAEARRRSSAPQASEMGDADLFGTAQGELLAEVGDVAAAIASLERAADAEPTAWLAARACELAAGLARDPEDAARWLDKALSRAPRSASARWARVTKRLELGRIEDALADVQQLEAQAKGGRARHAVWLRAGRAWQSAGLTGRAAALFERALRFAPEDPGALAGLGLALLGEGRETRGVSLLTRALSTAESRDQPTAPIALELARAIAERLGDLPTAIAHVSAIAPDTKEAPTARGLEGRWRARLGDLAGAVLAFARLREFAASMPPGVEHADASSIAALLLEAATLHRRSLEDPLAAQRYLAVALRLRPQDPDLRHAYREVGAALLRGHNAQELPAAPAPAQELAGETEPPRSDEERVDELTRRIQANARDDDAADELAALLEKLGRGHELVALLSARLEDATPEGRARLAPRARAALERMAAAATAAGLKADATLYEDALRSLFR
jgi:tetratricopeptide (TPR) repeat protein